MTIQPYWRDSTGRWHDAQGPVPTLREIASGFFGAPSVQLVMGMCACVFALVFCYAWRTLALPWGWASLIAVAVVVGWVALVVKLTPR